MNKNELITQIADSTGMTKADSSRAVDAFTEVVKTALQKDDTVSLIGFGTFLARPRKARTGRNPRTGETIEIAATNVPAFKPGKAFKDALN